ncbi:MAG: transcription-repair coupling factor, partial [Solirubrobacterales bacterium]
ARAEAVPEADLRPAGFAVTVGEQVELGDLAELLVDCGYERTGQVEERGQFAVRGGICDVFPATEDRAIRIELFGDEVESMRWFSTFTQRSLGDATSVTFDPAAELPSEVRALAHRVDPEAADDAVASELPFDRFRAPLDLVSEQTAVVVAGEEIEGTLADHWQDVVVAMPGATAHHLYVDVAEPLVARAVVEVESFETDQPHKLRAQRAESPARSVGEGEAELEKLTRSGYRTLVTFASVGEAERVRYSLRRLDPPIVNADSGPVAPGTVAFAEAPVTDGFMAPELQLAVVPWRRLVHRRRSEDRPAGAGRRITSFTDLRVGDYVVHADHGIARFAGFETKTVGGITRDYLELEYRGDDKVFSPSEQLAKISRYVGAEGHTPTLSKLGGRSWEGVKSRARRAAREIAGELLNLYAERQARKGHAFEPDGEEQMTFEAAFPYRETADQIDAIEAVKADLEAERPMDRLICGDVGYGKTEIALRAAHKVASEGKQVMVLVPTTVLAQQHYGSFRERFADTAIEVEVVSRFKPAAETRATVERFASGQADILVGTHRLLSRDVRAKDLGLLVIDEEQRFGVKQKELLRQLKLRVDVLAMSATPIPRTLQMSLAGIRDISVIETPPEGRRPVRTFVGPYDEQLVRQAVNRETGRGGQVFFLHNRVDTLHETAEGLRALCPDSRFLEAHGQMDDAELEETMLAFLRGEAQCLVTTTIIESGLDIPNANTLVVERADNLGLAQAYQIRGRVGRSSQRAFAYLLYPSADELTEQARQRLATLSDHTELGAGFKIAMRDLDLRGAGDLLGAERSGHVAAPGFELYCQLIDEAVEVLRAEGDEQAPATEPVRFDVAVDAYVPADYVPFEAAKIDVHRRIVAAREQSELKAMEAELTDRFGPVPDGVRNLLDLQAARIDFGAVGVTRVEFRSGKLSATGLTLASDQARALRERCGARYNFREKTVLASAPADARGRLDVAREVAAAAVDVSAGHAQPAVA